MLRLPILLAYASLAIPTIASAAPQAAALPAVPQDRLEPQIPSDELPDVPRNHWAFPAVSRLAILGIMEGHHFNRFDGDAPLTRYEFAVAIGRLLEPSHYARPATDLKPKPVLTLESKTTTPSPTGELAPTLTND